MIKTIARLCKKFYIASRIFWRDNKKSCLITLGILVFASLIVYTYWLFALDIEASDDSTSLTKKIELSNLHRNLAILFFGIFAGLLAIWSRIANERQLKQTDQQIENTNQQLQYTYEQIKNSLTANRNDRLVKAADMLGKSKASASYRGGLHILRDLIQENPKTEYIRCAEIIADWLKGDEGSTELRGMAMDVLGMTVKGSFTEKKRKKIIREYKNKYDFPFWPDLKGANLQELNLQKIDLFEANLERANLKKADLQEANLMEANLKNADLGGADLTGAEMSKAILVEAYMANASLMLANLTGAELENADLQESFLREAKMEKSFLISVNMSKAKLEDANLEGANLSGADLSSVIFDRANLKEVQFRRALVSGADMLTAKGVTEEQILQATWSDNNGRGSSPILPANLKETPEVQKWLEESPPRYERPIRPTLYHRHWPN